MDEVLKKCLNIWESPLNGNAIVILGRSKKSPAYVRVGDLDMGENYMVALDDLKVKLRESEPSDFGFSWTCEVEPDIQDAVEDAECERLNARAL